MRRYLPPAVEGYYPRTATRLAVLRTMLMQRTIRTFLLSLLMVCCPVAPAAPAAAQGTPSPVIVDHPEPDVILDITFDALPQTPAFVGIARLKFPEMAGIVGGSIPGPRLFLIETGQFAVLADDPATIWRNSDATRVEELPSGVEAVLLPGDLLIAPGTPPFTVVNTGDEPGMLLDIVIWPPIAERIRPFVTETGVIFEPLVIGDVQQLPENPARVLLQRFSMPRSAEESFELVPGPRLLYVESGVLGVATISGTVHYSSAASNTSGSVTGRVKTLSPGDEALLTAGGAVMIQAGAKGTIRNLGRTELDLLDLRFEPAAELLPT